jgi:hypothetical protein
MVGAAVPTSTTARERTMKLRKDADESYLTVLLQRFKELRDRAEQEAIEERFHAARDKYEWYLARYKGVQT